MSFVSSEEFCELKFFRPIEMWRFFDVLNADLKENDYGSNAGLIRAR